MPQGRGCVVREVGFPSGEVGEGLTREVAFEPIPEVWEQAIQAIRGDSQQIKPLALVKKKRGQCGLSV